jgi:hypothetical protein
MKTPSLHLCKLTTLPVIAVLFLMTMPCLTAAEEISEFWGSARVYSPNPSVEGQSVITPAEEASGVDVPGGKRAFKLPAQSRVLLRFNPLTNSKETRDFSFAKIIKAQVHATNPTTFSIRLAGGGPSMVGKMEHSGKGWELLELPLDETSLVAESRNNVNQLMEITLIDFIVTGEVSEGEDFLVADLVAE